MQTLGALTVWGGSLLFVLGIIAFVIVAFRESVLWGLGVLFVPVVSLVFLVLEWRSARRPFYWQLGGLALVMLGAFVMSAPLPWQHHHHHYF